MFGVSLPQIKGLFLAVYSQGCLLFLEMRATTQMEIQVALWQKQKIAAMLSLLEQRIPYSKNS